MTKSPNDAGRRAQVVEACDFAASSEELLRAVGFDGAEVCVNRDRPNSVLLPDTHAVS